VSEHEPCPFCGRASALSTVQHASFARRSQALCLACLAAGPSVPWWEFDVEGDHLNDLQAADIEAECWRRWDKRVGGVSCIKQ